MVETKKIAQTMMLCNLKGCFDVTVDIYYIEENYMKKLFKNAKAARRFGLTATKEKIEEVKKIRTDYLEQHKKLVQIKSADYDEMMMLNNQAHFCLICIEADAEARGRIKW